MNFSVIITFDLNYADSSDYRAVDRYLTDNGFEKLSSSGSKMPGNTYLGIIDEKPGNPLGSDLLADAKKVKQSIYRKLKSVMTASGISSTVFVQVSPSDYTTHSCSRPE
ncbi:hypothetical protein [Serratia fonticola]|uniref:hypothetical protein n=1 Tax=Serratia fonticola TaxID=47917 RepID=UPI00217B7DF1|nr:hypothetical protein [Serratia fonticola]CAI1879913.1 Uncharacterised protein [Serratia fonticola]